MVRRRRRRASHAGDTRCRAAGGQVARRRRLACRAIPAGWPGRGARALVGHLRACVPPVARTARGRTRGGGPPESRRVPRLDASGSASQRAAVAGGRDSTRPAEGQPCRADGAFSGAALSGRPDSRIPTRRARMGRRRTARGLPRCLALYRLVQPAAEPGGIRSSASLARGPAHRRAGRDATVGGAAGTRGCTDHRAVARRVGGAASAVRVERLPKHRRG